MFSQAIEIHKIIKNARYESFLVGGWIRDKLLNRLSNDIDIATNAIPEIIIDIFSKYKDYTIVPTGLKHGTVTIIKDDASIEVTTYRHDVTTDGRNATIKFTDTLEEDLSRRDFTINSLAYDPLTEKIIDPFNGQFDIKNRFIRTVGNPWNRFREDYLRLFRALRFGANLDFDITDDTWDGIHSVSKDDFSNILSIERVRDELNKCFKVADCPSIMLDDMYECGLLKKYLPELENCYKFKQNKYHKYDVYWHTLFAIDAVPAEFPLIRWSALFHDLGKPGSCENYGKPEASFHNHEHASEEIAINIMKRFKFSNEEISYISNLVRNHMFKYDSKMKDSAIRRLVANVGEENIDALCILKYGDRQGNGLKSATELNIDSTGLKQRLLQMSEKDKIFKIKDLDISGYEIMELLKISPCKKVGNVLQYLYEIVIEDVSKNDNEELKKLVLEYKGE